MHTIESLKVRYGKMYDEELRLESLYKDEAQEALRQMLEKAKTNDSASQVPLGSKLISYGFEDSYRAVEAWYNSTMAPKRGVRPAHNAILDIIKDSYSYLDAEGNRVERVEDMLNMLTLLPLMSLMDSVYSKHKELNTIVEQTFPEIFQESRIEAFIKTIPNKTLKGLESGISTRGDRRYKEAYARNVINQHNFVYKEWPEKGKYTLTYNLVEAVIKGSGFFEIISINPDSGADILPSVQPSEWLLRAWELNSQHMIDSTQRTCPMVIPPQQWESIDAGGYYGTLAGQHSLIRYRRTVDKETQEGYKARLRQTDLSDVFEAINTIQETPWRINRHVLKTLQSIYNSGGGRAGIPYTDSLPQLPPLIEPYTEEELKAHKQKKFILYKKDVIRASQANRYGVHMRTAERYAKYARIYFPYSMDFRGRVYPISTFSPQSDDINKGLLEFADVPACKSMQDISWLAIHGANCAGVDKVSFEERVKWVEDNEEEILACAKDPLTYRFWETQDDSSFQFLAFCFEWRNWKRYEKEHNGSPVGFISRIPIAFDGTCSGLQHYSAILRDSVGGAAVNLVPDNSPHDIYKLVANKVVEQLEKDAQNGTSSEERTYEDGGKGVKLGTQIMAQAWLARGVNRSVTKRCVMTLAYGSKEYGFKGQILEDTIAPDIAEGHTEMDTHKTQYAAYLAHEIWGAVQTTVVAAVEGMTYLQDLASIVAKKGYPVVWTTPIGLPLLQSYNIVIVNRIQLRLYGSTFRFAHIPQTKADIDARRQRTGIAPNFIHSMDACHLQMTVLHSKRDYNIKHFALIHDSYGAPASQAQDLFHAVRETFYKMYSENDVMKTFAEEILSVVELKPKKYEKLMNAMPQKGSLQIDKVLQSKYMFA